MAAAIRVHWGVLLSLALSSSFIPACGDDDSSDDGARGGQGCGSEGKGGSGGDTSAGDTSGGRPGGGQGSGGEPLGGSSASGGAAAGGEGGVPTEGGSSGSGGTAGEGGVTIIDTGGTSSGGAGGFAGIGSGGVGVGGGAESGGGGEAGSGPPNPSSVRWLGKCTPVALSDDAKTALALEGVWTEARGWITIPDLPGGDNRTTPRTLSGDGGIVYGDSASTAYETEIYRFNVETGAIQGLDIPYSTYLGLDSQDTPAEVHAIDTNRDGSILVGQGTGSIPPAWRWTDGAGLEELGIPFGDGAHSAVISANSATAVFSQDSPDSPVYVVSRLSPPPTLATEQFVSVQPYPLAVSGDGKKYSAYSTFFGWEGTGGVCLLPQDPGCQGTNLALFDLDEHGRVAIGREYNGLHGGHVPIGTFLWDKTPRVRYLHEALYDSGVLVDVALLTRAAISADGRNIFGFGMRHDSDGAGTDECFIAHLGDPPADPAPAPIVRAVESLAPVDRLWAGGDTSCVGDTDGKVYCWGALVPGPASRPANFGWRAREVPELEGAVDVALSERHGCALFANHTVHCWGDNSSGQLGDGTTQATMMPVAIAGVADATSIAVGNQALTCAARANNSVQCWGSGARTVQFSTSVRSLGMGGRFIACAVLTSGQAMCWTTDTETPFEVSQFGEVAELRGSHSPDGGICARSVSGSVLCTRWDCCVGNVCAPAEADGEFGRRAGFSSPVRIATGYHHACALSANGTVQCLGFGEHGLLGPSRNYCTKTALSIEGLSSVVALASGQSHTCALLASGVVRCWGSDTKGQLGFGFAYTQLPPSPSAYTPAPGLSRLAAVQLATE